jgi:hypothetical protein
MKAHHRELGGGGGAANRDSSRHVFSASGARRKGGVRAGLIDDGANEAADLFEADVDRGDRSVSLSLEENHLSKRTQAAGKWRARF